MDADLQIYREQSETPFDLGPQIGTGPYVVVRKARERGSKTWPYAQKTIDLDGLEPEALKSAKHTFVRELKTLRHAQHHHVVKFIDAFAVEGDKQKLAAVMDRADGNLCDYVQGKRWKKSDLDQIQRWFSCLASVVDYIHGIGIRHRDIKPENILVHNRKIRLADFGISQMGLGQTLSTTIPEWARGRTAAYCAPEVDQGSSRGRSADIFSLGAVFLELLIAHSYRPQLVDLREVRKYHQGPSYAKKIAEVHVWMNNFERTIEQTPEYYWHRKLLSLCRLMLDENRDERPKASQVKAELSLLPDSVLPPCRCSNSESMPPAAMLVEACKKGDQNSVRSIVESNANKALGKTVGAIHQASAHGYSAIVEYLLYCNAEVIYIQDHSNQTALHCAAGNQQETIVDILLRRGATVTVYDIQRRTALHYAAGTGNANIVSNILHQRGVQFNVKDQDGQTPLHFAAKRGHKEVVKSLLKCADPTIKDKKGQTALHLAAGYGSKEVVEMLRGKVDVNAKNADGSTALHYAAKGKHLEGEYEQVVKMLLEDGADPLLQDSDLHVAGFYANKNKSPWRKILREASLKADLDAMELSSEDSKCNQMELQENGSQEGRRKTILDDFHPDLISFITIAQYHKVDIWPLSWDPNLAKLGKGATGDVMQFTVDLEAQFAFKRFVSHRAKQISPGYTDTFFQNNDKLFMALMSELMILSQPQMKRHPHVVNIEGIAFDVESTSTQSAEVWPVLVFKKAHHGSLERYMNSANGKAIDFSARLRLCAQIGSAISAMHSNEIIHGDIKPANVLAYAHGQSVCAQVTDFSYSCLGKEQEDSVHVPKSESWHAPEHRRSEVRIRDAKLMDIYSFGMVCFWLLFPNDFRELLHTCRDGVFNENGQISPQSVAEKLASEEKSLSPSSRQSLASFFGSTLCEDPRERNSELLALIQLLGQTGWQPEEEQVLFDGTRRLTLADYHATKDDIEDPGKLQALTQKILNSVHLTGKEYDIMRDHLDSTKFSERQRSEWYINKVLEGLSLFSVPAPEKDDEVKENLIHSCVNIGPAFFQLVLLDYRVRVHIAACLQERSAGPCQKCVLSASAELALWYTLGFGVHSDVKEAQMWLNKSNITEDQLHQRLDGLKSMTIAEFEATTHSRSGSRGLFGVNLHDRYGSRNFKSAEAHISREVQGLEQYLGRSHWLIFELRMELCMLISEQGRHDESQKLLEEIRRSVTETYGYNHPFHVRVVLHLAELYRRQDLWEQAESLLEGAKSTLVEMLGSKHVLTIQVCLELSSIYADRGKIEEATKEFDALRPIVSERLHAGHPVASLFTERYSNFLGKLGNTSEADALRSQHAKEGDIPSKLHVLIEEHNRGRSARLMGNLDAAESLLLKVKEDAEMLAEREEKPERKSFITRAALVTTRNLALVYRDQKHFEKAKELQRSLKEDSETKLGQLHPVTLDVTYDLARTLEMQKEWVEAEELQLIVKKGRTTVLGSQHEHTIWTSQRLAVIYDAQGKLDDAEYEMEEAKNACAQRLGADHTETLEATMALGRMYMLHGKLELADEIMSMAVSIAQNVLGMHAEQTLGSMSNLGLVYLAQGRLEEAEELLKRTKDDLVKHLGHGHEFTRITEGHLARLYHQQGKLQKMSGLQEHDQPFSRQDIHLRPLSEDDQIQIAIQQSIQTQLGQPEHMDDGSDDDLKKTIEISLEKGMHRDELALSEKVLGKEHPDTLTSMNHVIVHGSYLHDSFASPSPGRSRSSVHVSVEAGKEVQGALSFTNPVQDRSAESEQRRLEEARDVGLKAAASLLWSGLPPCGRSYYKMICEGISRVLRYAGLADYPPPPGQVRVTWKNRRGKTLYDDYVENEPHAAQALQDYLNQRSPGGSTQGASGNSSAPPSLPVSAHTNYHGSRKGNSDQRESGGEGHNHGASLPETENPSRDVEAGREDVNRFLMPCMDRGRYSLQIRPEAVTSIVDDRQLFSALRRSYNQHRGRLRPYWSLKNVQSIHFMKFIYGGPRHIDVRCHFDLCVSGSPCECIPPRDRAIHDGEYRFNPIRPSLSPPIGPRLLIDYFTDPEGPAPDASLVLQQLPKRNCNALEPRSGELIEAWGIYFKEDWDLIKIWLILGIGFFPPSLLFGILWAVLKSDIQGAFGVASWWMTGATILVGIVGTCTWVL